VIEYDEREIAARKTLKIWEHRVPPVWDGAWFTPKTSPLPICVTTSNLVVLPHFCVKRYTYKYMVAAKIGERWGPAPLRRGVADP